MRDQKESLGVLKTYFGIDKSSMLIFSVLVVGVFIVVTGIYVAIFGYKNWKSNMESAGSMMVANFNTPTTGNVNNPVGSRSTGVQPGAPCLVPAPQAAQGQYVCPNCGAVGLPSWNQAGTPLCPNCGASMSLTGQARSNTQLAAAP